jgi:hypothetical protein
MLKSSVFAAYIRENAYEKILNFEFWILNGKKKEEEMMNEEEEEDGFFT